MGNSLFPVNWDPDKLGTGAWIRFIFDEEVPLLANHTYGFDVTVTLGDWGYFWESAGAVDDSYGGGSAFNSNYDRTEGIKSLYMDTVWEGDHTFVIVAELRRLGSSPKQSIEELCQRGLFALAQYKDSVSGGCKGHFFGKILSPAWL